MPTYRQLETSREIRLWIGQVIIPIAALVILSDEKKMDAVQDMARRIKVSARQVIDKLF